MVRLGSHCGVPSVCFVAGTKPHLQANHRLVLEHTFSLESDRYLVDHQLDGKPVLPATAAVEWFAELVQAYCTGMDG
uniref:Uncharacterized protein n=1 Tax=Desertifilum tharense IPPAS B-1220 TaxID=1781255 RepID=A0ACD5GRJ9_9CYAN